MSRYVRLSLSIVFFIQVSLGFSNQLMSNKDFLKKELATDNLKISKEDITPDDKLMAAIKETAPNAQESSYTFYYGKTPDGALKKACTSVPQKGKEGPMIVGICFSAAATVADVVILEYMEEKGKPVKEDRFLSQFRDKSITSPFQVGKDINGVTSATNSSKAVSEAVRKTSLVFKEAVLKKVEQKK